MTRKLRRLFAAWYAGEGRYSRPVRGAGRKSRGRLTVANVTGEAEERTRSVAAFRRRVQRLKGHVNEVKEKLAAK